MGGLIERIMTYARTNPQPVQLCWITRKVDTHSALAAVRLCAKPRVAANIVGAVADDKTMENLLNKLIDAD